MSRSRAKRWCMCVSTTATQILPVEPSSTKTPVAQVSDRFCTPTGGLIISATARELAQLQHTSAQHRATAWTDKLNSREGGLETQKLCRRCAGKMGIAPSTYYSVVTHFQVLRIRKIAPSRSLCTRNNSAYWPHLNLKKVFTLGLST